ncbi:hypothetical protein F4859DRAFT_519572 [Xylaria cf. heliscus]|nr:hypothetical protein F4859DRAFT_519572 [Xylaria cf. heliscus]
MFCHVSHCRRKHFGETNNKVPAVPSTTFPVFGNLPPELRLMIWEEFVRTPRVIRIDQTGKHDKKHQEGQFAIKINGLVREQACPLLGVCRESRSVVMKSLLLFTIGSKDPVMALYRKDRHFAISRSDVVFFSGSRVGFNDIKAQGDTHKIANIMLGATVHIILGTMNTSESIWANWLAFGYSGLRLTQRLNNRECLEKIYGLVHQSNNSGAVGPFDMDELCGFIPSQPPQFKRGLADWLKHQFLEEREWNMMSQPALLPHLLMRESDLTPWVNSKQVVVTGKK